MSPKAKRKQREVKMALLSTLSLLMGLFMALEALRSSSRAFDMERLAVVERRQLEALQRTITGHVDSAYICKEKR